MKKWIALAMACALMLSSAALAAAWPEGRGPSQPYSGKPEVNLSKTMGYIMRYPRAKWPAKAFCDVLRVYLPREDVNRGQGTARLFEIVEGQKKPVERCTIDFSDEENVRIYPMDDAMLDLVMWGSGVCVEMRLPRSLELGGHRYLVTMDEGCYVAADGAVRSAAVRARGSGIWEPVVEGEYGVSGLFYSKAPEAPADADDEDAPGDGEDGEPAEDAPGDEPEPTPEPTTEAPADPATAEIVTRPRTGDRITFDLVMGGEAASAVIHSDNGSVNFRELEYTASATLTGEVIKDEVDWGVVFLRADGSVLDDVDLSR